MDCRFKRKTYDVKTIAAELRKDAEQAKENWLQRILCAVGCWKRRGFSASLTRCLADAQCYDKGHEECKNTE